MSEPRKHALRLEMDSILGNITEGYRAKQAPPSLPSDEWEFEDNELSQGQGQVQVMCDCGRPAVVKSHSIHREICERCHNMSRDAKKYGFRDGTLKWCSCCTVRLAVPGMSLCSRTACREKTGFWS